MERHAALHEAADLVLQIELAMRRTRLWHTRVPTPEAMASRLPFCADTLAFTEWLQFVFLPRMHILLQDDEALPRDSNIAAMAEEALPGVEGRAAVLAPIRAFDTLIANYQRDAR